MRRFLLRVRGEICRQKQRHVLSGAIDIDSRSTLAVKDFNVKFMLWCTRNKAKSAVLTVWKTKLYTASLKFTGSTVRVYAISYY